jgi:hypothetical protein
MVLGSRQNSWSILVQTALCSVLLSWQYSVYKLLRLNHEEARKVVFRGQYTAVTDMEILDMCVLGRDITRLFAVIIDQPGAVVCLLGQRHQYTIVQR